MPVGAVQVYKVPLGTIPLVISVGVIAKPTPLQVTVVIVLITAVGFIVTITVNDAATPHGVLGVTI